MKIKQPMKFTEDMNLNQQEYCTLLDEWSLYFEMIDNCPGSNKIYNKLALKIVNHYKNIFCLGENKGSIKKLFDEVIDDLTDCVIFTTFFLEALNED